MHLPNLILLRSVDWIWRPSSWSRPQLEAVADRVRGALPAIAPRLAAKFDPVPLAPIVPADWTGPLAARAAG